MRRALACLALTAGLALVYACAGDSADPAQPGAADAGVDAPIDAATSPDAEGGASAGNYFKSGARLRAQVLSGDGLPVFETFFDTTRNAPCEYVKAIDGSMRCVALGNEGVFLDAACTSPAAIVSGCTNPTGFARFSKKTFVCDRVEYELSEVRPIAAEIAAATMYVRSGKGTCEAIPVSGNIKLHAVGASVPITDFVRGTLKDEAPAPSLRRKRIVGEDGSELALPEIVDAVRNTKCDAYRLVPPNTPRTVPADFSCVPQNSANNDTQYGPFSDSSCTTPSASRFVGPGCEEPAAILRSLSPAGGSNCGDDYGYAVYERGAATANGFRFSGTCDSDVSPNRSFFALGAPITAAALPALREEPLGSGRLRPLAFTANGVQVSTAYFWDDQAKARCSVYRFADGKQRCVGGAYLNPPSRFKDASCTQPMAVFYGCGQPSVALTGAINCETGAYDVDVRPLGPKLAITSYYEKQPGGACDATPIALDPQQSAYDFAAPVPASTLFMEVTRSRE
jgi:hypothetical protein